MTGIRTVLLLLLLSAGVSAAERGSGSDRFLAQDKLKHFSMSLMLTAQGSYTEGQISEPDHRIVTAPIAVLMIGIGKEAADRHRGDHFCWKDLLADAVGIAAGLFIVNQIR